jgi:hypothetical protein
MIQLPALDNFGSWTDAESDPRSVGDVGEALAAFRGILGTNWDGWRANAPLCRQFFMTFQGGAPEGVRLHKMVRALDGAKGVACFIRETLGRQRWREYLAGVMGLEFCSRIRKSAHDVVFVERTHEKSPDVRVRLVDREITFEFKALHESDDQEPWNELVEGLVTLLPVGATLSDFQMELAENALIQPEALIEGLTRIWLTKANGWHDLPRAAGRAQLSGQNLGRVTFPIVQRDDLSRIAVKLRQGWWQQLRAEIGPTILVVQAGGLFGDPRPPMVLAEAERIAAVVAPLLPDKKMVGAVLVYAEPFWEPVRPAYSDRTSFRVRMDTSPVGTARFMVLVPNMAPRIALDPAELDRLIGPGIAW